MAHNQPQQVRKDIFSKIAETEVTQRDSRLGQGDYTLKLLSAIHKPDGHNGESFGLRFEVTRAAPVKGICHNEVGDIVGFFWNVTKNKYGFGDVKKTIAALAQKSFAETTGDLLREAFSENQPLTNALVVCRVAPGDKLNAEGQPYINSNFSPAPKPTPTPAK